MMGKLEVAREDLLPLGEEGLAGGVHLGLEGVGCLFVDG